MRVAVVIPTFNRLNKLERCLNSLEKQTYKSFDTYIYCDNNDKKTFNFLENSRWADFVSINTRQEFVIGSWNRFLREEFFQDNYDIMMWCVDDVECYHTTLEKAVACMITNFPDTDGVVGINQECPGHPSYTFKWYGQVLLGRKFIERYKQVNYQVCCPDYHHFYQDEEMWEYANSVGKFINCPEAILKHYHPGFIKSELDSTHPLVRGVVMQEDKAIRNIRLMKGYTWGKDFNLVK